MPSMAHPLEKILPVNIGAPRGNPWPRRALTEDCDALLVAKSALSTTAPRM